MTMDLSQDATLFLLGGLVGLVSAVAGAVVDYRRSLGRVPPEERKLPGCMFIVPGALGLIGAVVILIAYFAGVVGRALRMGLGVGLGFFAGFILMTLLWFLLDRR
jgi:hypothetical protein